jgi:hypothetical protein
MKTLFYWGWIQIYVLLKSGKKIHLAPMKYAVRGKAVY